MRKKLMALISVFVLLLTPSLVQAQAADSSGIPDEQLMTPRPPVENTGGFSGAHYDDQKTLYRAFTYVEAWATSDYATNGAVTCLTSQEEPC